MASSLDPDNFPEAGKRVPKGHGYRSLGPSDSSDSGSDLAGPGIPDEDALDLDPIEDEEMEDESLALDAEDGERDDLDEPEADPDPVPEEEERSEAEVSGSRRPARSTRKARGRPHRTEGRGRRAVM